MKIQITLQNLKKIKYLNHATTQFWVGWQVTLSTSVKMNFSKVRWQEPFIIALFSLSWTMEQPNLKVENITFSRLLMEIWLLLQRKKDHSHMHPMLEETLKLFCKFIFKNILILIFLFFFEGYLQVNHQFCHWHWKETKETMLLSEIKISRKYKKQLDLSINGIFMLSNQLN